MENDLASARPIGTGVGARRAAAALLGLCGIYQLVLGFYFVALRPPLLPEDLSFLGTTPGIVAVAMPRLEAWLNLVFTVVGGQMVAVGSLTTAFAIRVGRSRGRRHELVALGLAGAMSVGLMSLVNFALGSDFRWLLVVPVIAWTSGLVLAACTPDGVPDLPEKQNGR